MNSTICSHAVWLQHIWYVLDGLRMHLNPIYHSYVLNLCPQGGPHGLSWRRFSCRVAIRSQCCMDSTHRSYLVSSWMSQGEHKSALDPCIIAARLAWTHACECQYMDVPILLSRYFVNAFFHAGVWQMVMPVHLQFPRA